jgi:hypothetical protein
LLLAVAVAGGVVVLAGGAGGIGGSAHAATPGIGEDNLIPIQERILSGTGSMELGGDQKNEERQPSNYYPSHDECQQHFGSNVKVNQNCLNLTDPDLQGRGQAENETAIAENPFTNNGKPWGDEGDRFRTDGALVATYNDYRRGDGNCWGSYSLQPSGQQWNDTTIPMGFTRGRVQNVVDFGASREYWGGGGDTSVAWDTKNNVYTMCQVFNRGRPTSSQADTSSALLVFRSTQNDGASWSFPGRYARASNDVSGTGLSPFLDKPYLTVDNHVGSPYQDRVYVAWTEFAANGSAFIYEAYSSDYGEHFSRPHLVSLTSPLCTVTYGAGTQAITGENSNCNENQFADPFTGPDGALYIAYNNFNNDVKPGDNRNQIFVAKSVDGGNTFLPPVKASDYYDLPDCATYQGGQDFGRACVPEKGPTMRSVFRATNYPSGAVDPRNPNKVVITFGSYINKHSNESNGCIPTGVNPATGQNLFTGVKTPGACNNDILRTVSTDGGLTFDGTAVDPRLLPTVTPTRRQALSDQWWQWASISRQTGKLAVSYYDRQYDVTCQRGGNGNGNDNGNGYGNGNDNGQGSRDVQDDCANAATHNYDQSGVPGDEYTGWSDFSISGSDDPLYRYFGVRRVTTSSMPPPTQFAGTFWGDYTGLDAVRDQAHPIWSDTRNPELVLCPGSAGPPPAGQTSGGPPPAVCTATIGPDATGPRQTINDQDIFTDTVPIPTGNDENNNWGGGGGGGR